MSYEVVSNLERLKAKLDFVQEAGFDTVEIPIQGMNVITNGEIETKRLHAYAKLFSDTSLHFTMHAPFDLNLFRQGDAAFESKLFMTSLEVTGALGSEVLVYHVGRFISEEQFIYPHSWRSLTIAEKQQLMQQEVDLMRIAGDRAKQLNVRIGMENMRPYLDCPHYCYSVVPKELARQVAAVNHSHVGITLDIGHLYLSTQMYGLHLQEELEAMMPYILHIHMHDNFGKPCFSTEKNQYELTPHGRGDMHMPIGKGGIPIAEIAKLMENTAINGYLIHEVREQYESHWADLAQKHNLLFLKSDAQDKQYYAG
ncbi:sugar phosphate isomerase/epimerase family protein [Paenibacillus prosopidis]|uniref:Sugar phosphate isomerase/epimerase n=1 Tax=Paenibacillus prosopidis TaxID=630520 RepID=A0A368W6W8_9BACL|nr:sugar phosphate isomerase/epimerase family protein [Paenibacillus prosopidis]RCW51730.1 sugar phosphate isomerase/epimerase [Paenibacillus prosopidis]